MKGKHKCPQCGGTMRKIDLVALEWDELPLEWLCLCGAVYTEDELEEVKRRGDYLEQGE